MRVLKNRDAADDVDIFAVQLGDKSFNIRDSFLGILKRLQLFVSNFKRDSTGVILDVYHHGVKFAFFDEINQLRPPIFGSCHPARHINSPDHIGRRDMLDRRRSIYFELGRDIFNRAYEASGESVRQESCASEKKYKTEIIALLHMAPPAFVPEADQKPRTATTMPVTIVSVLASPDGRDKKGIKMTQSPKMPTSQFCHILNI